ncbi:MAG: PhzF family phenazine biosynthesis isomerase [Steroidobacteraceae bacterium]
MPHTIRVFQVDAFTQRAFTGNPAGVVLDADVLSDAQMQAIARELNNGDTAFVLKSDGADHDVRVRFFTPRTEAGFVGHATVAAHAVLATLPDTQPGTLRQKQRTGLVSVFTAVDRHSGIAQVAIAQPPPRLGRVLAPTELGQVLAALGLTTADLDPKTPAQIAGEGSTRLLLGLASGAALTKLQPDQNKLAALSPLLGASGYFVFSRQPTLPGFDTEARMFCPALGIAEDPVSGNAHGMLGAYLLKHALLPAGTTGFLGAQGHHMGRPGSVRIGLDQGAEGLRGVTIQGDAVTVFATTLELKD